MSGPAPLPRPDDPDPALAALPGFESSVIDRVDAASADRPSGPQPGGAVPRAGWHTELISASTVDQSSHRQHAGRDMYQAQSLTINQFAPPTVPTSVRRVVVLWEQIHRSADRAVTVDGVAEAADRLYRHRVLFLVADPGQGASTARLCIAHRLSDTLRYEPPVERIALDDEEETLDGAAREWDSSRLVIVDASSMPDQPRTRLIDDVAAVKAIVDRTDSFLMVTVPRADLVTVRARYPDWVVELGKPDGTEVFRRHLADRIDDHLLADVLADQWFLGEVRDAWPERAAQLADLAAQSATRTRAVDALRAEVQAASSDWTEQLRAEIDAATDARTRSLLLAAALVEGGPPAAVVALAEALVTRSKYAEAEAPPHPLVATSVVTRVARVGQVSAGPDRVVFSRPAYGRAVLPYVWSEHPDLRPALRSWLVAVPDQRGLGPDELTLVVDRVAELAAARGADLVYTCARGWIARGARTLAERLLTIAATDRRIGRDVRRQLWIWSKSAGPDLQYSVAMVCGGGYGGIYPANALTRLKHLAVSAAQTVRAAVVDAVATIAQQIGPYRLLGHLQDWMAQPDPARAATLARALHAALVRPTVRARLHDDAHRHSGPDGTAVRFWRRALDSLPYDIAADLITTWLNAVDDGTRDTVDLLVDQLVTAAGEDRHRLVQLSWGARGPQGNRASQQLMQRLLTRLDIPLLGIAPEAAR